jgi:hypothetical protein
MNFHAGAGVWANQNKVTNVAAWARWESGLVFERIGANLCDK